MTASVRLCVMSRKCREPYREPKVSRYGTKWALLARWSGAYPSWNGVAYGA